MNLAFIVETKVMILKKSEIISISQYVLSATYMPATVIATSHKEKGSQYSCQHPKCNHWKKKCIEIVQHYTLWELYFTTIVTK